nr:hypothetical protein [Candidatus Bipolaricaulota bacterium]
PEQLFTISYRGQEERAISLRLAPHAAILPGASPGSVGAGEAATDPAHEELRQGSLGAAPATIPFLDALLDEDVQAEELAGLLGIGTQRIHLITCGGEADRLRLMLVELGDALFAEQGAVDGAEHEAGALWEVLAPLAGTGAVMVWAASTTGAEFTPYAFYIQQAGSTFLFFSRSSFVDLTEGFTAQRRLGPGEASAGIVLLHKGIELQSPYTMHYCGGASEFGGETAEDVEWSP